MSLFSQSIVSLSAETAPERGSRDATTDGSCRFDSHHLVGFFGMSGLLTALFMAEQTG